MREDYEHELIWHWGLSKPVMAAINGACAGIAVALVAFCDLRYAVEGAKLTTAAPRLGRLQNTACRGCCRGWSA